MKTSIKLISALLCIIMLAGCSSSMKQHSSSEGYTVSIPKSWKTFNTSSGLHAYASKQDTSSVKISVTSAGEFISVTDWWNDNVGKLSETFDDLSEIKTTNSIIDGAAALRAEFTAALTFPSESTEDTSSASGDEGSTAATERKYKYCFIHVHIYKGGNIYSLIFSSSEENYEERVSDFEEIISSFRFSDASDTNAEANTEKAPSGMQSAALKNTDYTICIPLDWTLTHGDGYVEAHTKTDGTTVSVYSWDLSDNMTLDEWWNTYLSEISPIAKELNVISSESTELDGEAAVHKVFTAEIAGESFKFSQYAVIYDYILRVVTFTSSADDFDSHSGEFAQIIGSFKLDR